MTQIINRIKIVLTILTCCAATPALAGSVPKPVALMVDDMMPLTLPAPAESIFIANPSIVDAVVHNGSRIVLHGRMPGATDLFVFDDAGEVVLRRRVTVGAGGAPYVTVFRGSARQSYICTPYCAPGLVFGDDPTRMNTLITLSRKRGSLARSHAYQRESDFEDDAEE